VKEQDDDVWTEVKQELQFQATPLPRPTESTISSLKTGAGGVVENGLFDGSAREEVLREECARSAYQDRQAATLDVVKREALARISAQQAEDQALRLEEVLSASLAQSSMKSSSAGGTPCEGTLKGTTREVATLADLLRGSSTNEVVVMPSQNVAALSPPSAAAVAGQHQQAIPLQQALRAPMMAPPADPHPAGAAAPPSWGATPSMAQLAPSMYWSPAAPVQATWSPAIGLGGGSSASIPCGGRQPMVSAAPSSAAATAQGNVLTQGGFTSVASAPIPPWRLSPQRPLEMAAPSPEAIARATAQAQAHAQRHLQEQQLRQVDRAVTNYRWQLVERGFPAEVVQTYVNSYAAAMRNEVSIAEPAL